MKNKDLYISELEEANHLLTERLERETLGRESVERQLYCANDLLYRYKEANMICKFKIVLTFERNLTVECLLPSRSDVLRFLQKEYSGVCGDRSPSEIKIYRHRTDIRGSAGAIDYKQYFWVSLNSSACLGFGQICIRNRHPMFKRELYVVKNMSHKMKTMNELISIVISYLSSKVNNEK